MFLIKRTNEQTGAVDYRTGFMRYGAREHAESYTIDEAVILAHQISTKTHDCFAVHAATDLPVNELDIYVYLDPGLNPRTIIASLYWKDRT